MNTLREMRRALLACAMGTLAATGIHAQDQDSGGTADRRTLDEIIITAQKREQNIQDVPIVVTTVDAALIRDTGIRDIKDLTILTPGMIVTSTSNETSTTARIRGVGTVGDNIGLESSVGIVIDEVYRPRNGVGFGDLGELERIEVLKGPQGTLFGKNTSAGVVNITTKKPEFDFGANAELTYGNYGYQAGSLSLTGPLAGDKLAGRIYYGHRKNDGYLDIRNGMGPRVADYDNNTNIDVARGQLLWVPNDEVSVRLIADWAEREERCCIGVHLVNGATAPIINALAPGGIAIPANAFARVGYANRDTRQTVEDKGASMQVDWDMQNGARFTSVTGYRDWQANVGQDSDFSGAGLLFRFPESFGNQFKSLTQEFRLSGETDRLSWLVGAFYADEDLDSINALRYDTQIEPYISLLLSQGTVPNLMAALLARPLGTSYVTGQGSNDVFAQSSKSYALFTNNTFRFTDRLEATLGLRYTDEEKKLHSAYDNTDNGIGCGTARTRALNGSMAATLAALGVPAAQIPAIIGGLGSLGCAPFADPLFNDFVTDQKIDEGEWSGTAKLAFRFTDDMMGYASYAKGYKAGGFNLDRERLGTAFGTGANTAVADADTSFAPETVDSYEIGLKSSWADNSLALNIAGFYQEYTDFQLNTFTGIAFEVVTIPEVTSQGVDLDFVWYPQAEGLSFQGGVTYADTTYGDNLGTLPAVLFRLPGSQMSFAPEWSGSLSGTYERDIGANLMWRVNVGAKYMSEYNTGSDLAPTKAQDAFTLVNARLGIGSQSQSWMVELWGQNVTDEDYIQVGFDATLQPGTTNAFLGAPQTYGVTLRMQF